MAAGGEIPCNTINGLLSARKYGTERVEQFIKKDIVIPRSKFLWSPKTQLYSNAIEKNRTRDR